MLLSVHKSDLCACYKKIRLYTKIGSDMISEAWVLNILDRERWASFVHIWLRVSQSYDLSIRLVPRENLIKVLRQLADAQYITVPEGDSEYVDEFRLTLKGLRRKLGFAALQVHVPVFRVEERVLETV